MEAARGVGQPVEAAVLVLPVAAAVEADADDRRGLVAGEGPALFVLVDRVRGEAAGVLVQSVGDIVYGDAR